MKKLVANAVPESTKKPTNTDCCMLICHHLFVRSDEGLTLETSAFQIFHGSNCINSFDKTKSVHVSLSHRRSTIVSLKTGNLQHWFVCERFLRDLNINRKVIK